jgi:hypothetical protein
MLSSKLRTVYSFNDYGRWAERELGGHAQYHLIGDIKEVIRVKAASPYIRPGTWNASEEQLRLMLEQQVEPIGSRIEGTWSACLDEALFFTGKEGL